MNNSTLRIVLFVVAAVTLGAVAWYQFIAPELQDRDKLAKKQEQLIGKNAQVGKAQAEARELEKWRKLSLPSDTSQARLNYDRYLLEMCKQSGWQVESLTPDKLPEEKKETPGNKTKTPPAYIPLTFQLKARATVAELAAMLNRFQQVPVLHRFKMLRLERATASNVSDPRAPLRIEATIEALVVQGAQPRPGSLYAVPEAAVQMDILTALQRGPVPLALASWAAAPNGPLGSTPLREAGTARQYVEMAKKNIFVGYIPPVNLSLSIADVSIKKGEKGLPPAELKVSLNHAPTQPVTVKYATRDGSAKAGSAFKKVEGELVFKPGEKSQTITVDVVAEASYKEDAAFYVELHEALEASISRSKGKVTIRKTEEPEPPPPTKPMGPDMTPYVKLTFITETILRPEAYLRNHVTNRTTKLRTTDGYNTFKVTDETGEQTQMLGKVLKIDDRNVYFQAQDLEVYRLHIGMSVFEALERPMKESELKAIDLWPVPGEPSSKGKTVTKGKLPPPPRVVVKEEKLEELPREALKALEALEIPAPAEPEAQEELPGRYRKLEEEEVSLRTGKPGIRSLSLRSFSPLPVLGERGEERARQNREGTAPGLFAGLGLSGARGQSTLG